MKKNEFKFYTALELEGGEEPLFTDSEIVQLAYMKGIAADLLDLRVI